MNVYYLHKQANKDTFMCVYLNICIYAYVHARINIYFYTKILVYIQLYIYM